MREHGDIFTFDRQKRYGFIWNSKRQQVLFSMRSVRPDPNTLSRAWSFAENGSVPATFVQVQRLATNGKMLLAAEDVAPLFPFEESTADVADLREVMIVQQVIRDYGWAIRPDGDEVFIHIKQVLDQFRDRWKLLRGGVAIYAGVKMEEGLPRANKIELYSEAEIRGEQPEPDTPFNAVLKSVPAQTFESELLTPAFRSRSLLEIIQERRNGKQQI